MILQANKLCVPCGKKKMANESKKSAFSIIELLVVITIIASLVGLAIPAINLMQQSYNSTGTEQMISAALSNARSIAMSKQRYAGVRFQKAYTPNEDDKNATWLYDGNNDYIKNRVLAENQYMIFIINGDFRAMDNIWTGYHVVKGLKPIKLPENIGIMDMTNIGTDGEINDPEELINATAFSIIFSPSGKLVLCDVRTRNKDGKYDPADLDESNDDVFNSDDNIVDNKTGLFIQDDYSSYKLEKESSRNSFVIYDRKTFAGNFNTGDAYLGYLKNLKEHNSIYINAYTGSIIER